ncbi:rRNA maturation RNase YbeY, partial [Streptococcus pseudopneumoniae]|uniref:rRNA maturation RNase YbeY n=1 Tax=Streptococcus pseudopneumoniae TaxID=257758 RepID=UPI00110C2BCE
MGDFTSPEINFFSEEIDFELKEPQLFTDWIKKVVTSEGRKLVCINYIFCSDSYLSKINRKYLKNNSLTDIISFDQSSDTDEIEGDIFISIDRVRENAKALTFAYNKELALAIIHGVLHLIGYNDKNPTETEEMRKKEEA